MRYMVVIEWGSVVVHRGCVIQWPWDIAMRWNMSTITTATSGYFLLVSITSKWSWKSWKILKKKSSSSGNSSKILRKKSLWYCTKCCWTQFAGNSSGHVMKVRLILRFSDTNFCKVVKATLLDCFALMTSICWNPKEHSSSINLIYIASSNHSHVFKAWACMIHLLIW